VFRGYDAEHERLVAIKLFTIELAPDRVGRLVGRFERLIASNLTHPAIAAPLAAGISGPSAYFAHEFVAGESLDLAIREYGPAPASDALRVAAQLAGALDFAAAASVYHGALHPRDVLLSADDTRVTGLGIAQSLEHVGVAAPVRRPYSAPERVAGAGWDRRADIFSLAALIYELISGRRVSGTPASLSLDDVAGADADALSRVFARALADNPADRFETALSFVGALENAFGQPSTVKSSARVEPEATVSFAEPGNPSRRDAIDPVIRPEPQVGEIPLKPDATDVAAAGQGRFAEIAAADQERYRDVEVAPAIVAGATDRSQPAARSLGLDERRSSEPPVPVLIADRARSAVWPLVAALGIGIALGFAGGYSVGVRDRSPSAAAEPAGREFTEGAVPDAKPEVRRKLDATGTSPDATPGPANSGAAIPPSREASADRPGGGGQPDASATAPRPNDPAARNDTATRSDAQTPRKPSLDRARGGPDLSASSGSPRTASRGDRAESRDATRAGSANAVSGLGRLLVRSTPAGARVSIDGRDAGVTPAVVRDLARGSHSVRVTRDGYIAEERRIVITPQRQAVSITVPLSPAVATGGRFLGDLIVQSLPTGAKVFLDGKLIGMTPLSIRAVRAGEHAVRLEYDGYRRWSSVVRVVANEANRVTASLER
jgi:hypothetical protein